MDALLWTGTSSFRTDREPFLQYGILGKAIIAAWKALASQLAHRAGLFGTILT
jgi:hypothetical protein